MRNIGEEAKLQEKNGIKKTYYQCLSLQVRNVSHSTMVPVGQDQKHLSIFKRSLSG